MKHIRRVSADQMSHHALSHFFGQLIQPIRWLRSHSFAPRWIPQRWQPPPVGYSVALLLQITLGLMSMTVLRSFPDFNFFGILNVFGDDYWMLPRYFSSPLEVIGEIVP